MAVVTASSIAARAPADLADFVEELNVHFYRTHAGLEERADPTEIFDRYPHLSDRGFVESSARAATAATPATRREAECLHIFAIDNYIERSLHDETTEILGIEDGTVARIDGFETIYANLPAFIAAESDRMRRRSLEAARRSLTREKLTPVCRRRIERLGALCREIGYRDYVDLTVRTHDAGLRAFTRFRDAVLQNSEVAYRRELDASLRAAEMGDLVPSNHDITYALHTAAFDEFFARERLMDAVTRSFEDMGLPLDGIAFDMERRRGKSCRTFMSPIRIPERIVISMDPYGGLDDYKSLVHEVGHAQVLRNIDPSLPAVLQHVDFDAVSETFGFLFLYLVSEPRWLTRYVGIGPELAKRVQRYFHFHKLFFLRKYFSLLSYEVDLFSAAMPETEWTGRYASDMAEATGVAHPWEYYLYDLGLGFPELEMLYALSLEPHVRARLRTVFGQEWFRVPAAADYMKTIWRRGSGLTAAQLAAELGLNDISPEAAVRESVAVLGGQQ